MELKDLLGENYKDGMTMEEVNTALKDVALPTDQTAEIERLKGVISKSNSEAADWKRKFQATQTEDEQKKAKDEEERQNLLNELAELKKAQAISGYKASYLAMGYDEKLAEEAANAVANGDTAKALEVQKKHQESMAEKIKKEILRAAGRPVGDPESGHDDDNGDSDVIKLARQIGKQRASEGKAADDVMKYYAT
jgi:hypothetical protein